MANAKQSHKVVFVDPAASAADLEKILGDLAAAGWEFVGTAGPCGIHGQPLVFKAVK